MSLMGIAYATLPAVTVSGASASHVQAASGNGKLSQLLQGQILWQDDWSGGVHGAWEKSHHDPPAVGGTR